MVREQRGEAKRQGSFEAVCKQFSGRVPVDDQDVVRESERLMGGL